MSVSSETDIFVSFVLCGKNKHHGGEYTLRRGGHCVRFSNKRQELNIMAANYSEASSERELAPTATEGECATMGIARILKLRRLLPSLA